MVRVPEMAQKVCRQLKDAGGVPYIVGGYVRDSLMGLEPKDIDIECYKLFPEEIISALQDYWELDVVGKSFGVIKIKHWNVEISVPRLEKRTGIGHNDFGVSLKPFIQPKKACARRDFTINTLMCDSTGSRIFDYWDGQKDLNNKVLRHTSERFVEDPLRVLRGMQFCARFDLTPTTELLNLCSTMTQYGLPKERLFEEWKKLFIKGMKPSVGLNFLERSGWIRFYPELQALIGCEQNPSWHPEGDVWIHTLLALDHFAKMDFANEEDTIIVGLAVLCHDFGKPRCIEIKDGRITTPKHEIKGVEPVTTFINRLTDQKNILPEVLCLVKDHLTPLRLHESNSSVSAIRRLSTRVKRIDRLLNVVECDLFGKGDTSHPKIDAVKWTKEKAEELSVLESAPQPILMGRHLIDMGYPPSENFGIVLDRVYELQLDGMVKTLSEAKRQARFVFNEIINYINPVEEF